jgi:NAD(P)H-hydrate epimerase
LLAQTRDAEQATLLGVYLHGLAGDIEYSTKGNGLIAGDIVEALPRALLKLGEPDEPCTNNRLRKLQ